MSILIHNPPFYALKCAVWELTLGCNFRCVHCGASAGIPRSDELRTDEALKLCDDLADAGCEGVGLIGGEPFIRKDWLQISKRIKENDMDLSYVSNGWLVNEQLIREISKLRPRSFGLSLDGTKSIHDRIRKAGSFDRCMTALKILDKFDIPTTIITTVHKLNKNCLNDIKNLISSMDVVWQIQVATPHGNRFSRENFLSKGEFYNLLRFVHETRKEFKGSKNFFVSGAHDIGYFSSCYGDLNIWDWVGCQAGISVIGIQSNGNVKGCLSLPDEFIEANVRDKSIKEIWNSSGFFPYTRNFSDEKLKGNCKTCKYGAKCKGGCSDISYSVSGELHNNPYCAYNIEKEMKLTHEN